MSAAESQSAAAGLETSVKSVAEQSTREFRVLFCSWSELDIASGTPVIVCDMLRHFSFADAEVLTESNVDQKRRRKITVEHRIRKYRFHTWLWPFARGHRIRTRLARYGLPVLVAQIVLEIFRFRPDCIFAIYAQPHWITATWIASRITGVPLIYHIHDAFLEVDDRRQRSEIAKWLEKRTLTSARVLALDDTMAEHYERRYGIHCTVLRHIVRHEPFPAKLQSACHGEVAVNGLPAADGCAIPDPRRPITIGFAGAIYDSNSRQLAEMCRIVNDDPTLRLKIWTGSPYDSHSIRGPRVEVAFEADYERLLRHIASCDLLYLPLQFFKGTNMAANAMAFSLPTKSFDYALSGVPMLVHCPEEFALSRFFVRNRCGYVLNDPNTEAVRQWIEAWRVGAIPPLDESDRLKTLGLHSVEENKRVLWQVLAEEADRRAKRKELNSLERL